MKKKVSSKIKTKVDEFLLGEDGKVSKSNILKAGLMIAAASLMLSQESFAGHSNALSFNTGSECFTHGNHNSHASHASY